jgi:pilus assembly protein FimV
VSEQEAESLDVSMASRSDYARAGVDYPLLAGLMSFALEQTAGGYQVVITTEDAVDDTYLHFLVSAVWSGGKAVREYTALMDPPLYSEQTITDIELAGSDVGEGGGESVPEAAPTRSADTSGAMVAGGGGEVTVQRGDTLSHIVKRMDVPTGVNELQAFLAIFRSNPQAFIDNNMNLLRAGAVLSVPTFEEMGAVSRSESVATFSEQLARFTAYQNRVRQQQETDSNETLDRLISESTEAPASPAPVEEEPVAPEAEDIGLAAAEPVAEPVEDSVAPVVTPEPEISEPQPVMEDARLTIGQEDQIPVPADGDNQAQLDALKAQLAQLDESLLAGGVENESVRRNLQQIQSQVERISTLIEVEDTSLAAAQSRALQDSGSEPADESAGEDAVATATVDGAGGGMSDDTQTAAAEPMVEIMDTPAPDAAEESLAGAGMDESADDAAADAEMGSGDMVSDSGSSVDPEASVESEVSTESEEVLLAQQDAPAPDAGAVTGDDSGTTGSAMTDSMDSTAMDDTAAGDSAADAAAADEAGSDQATAQAVAATEEAQGTSDQASRVVRKVSESSLLDSVKGLFSSLPDYGLKIAAGLLVMLAGLFIWQRRKSRKEFDASMLDIETEEVSMNSETSIQRMSDASGIDLASASDSALELTIGGGMSYLSEEGIAGVNEEDNEVIKAGAVDPLAEADVYLAYDRDEQAVQVLKEAYADTPERGELAEKLLEIYHKQDDRRAFDALATELHRRMDTTQNLNWENVVAMGREVSPDNALFAGDGPRTASGSDGTLNLDDDLLDDTPSGQINITEGGLNLATIDSGEDSISNLEVDDLDLDVGITPSPSDSDDVDAPTLSQIINEDVEKVSASAEEAAEELISLTGDEVSLDLGGEDHEFNLIEAESKRGIAAAGDSNAGDGLLAAGEGQDDDMVALDEDSSMSDEVTNGKLEPYHESETALELAKAYMELGEQEIAKGFIEEVLNEGSEKQKTKARTMIKDLAT